MKRIYFNKIMKGVAAAAVLFGAASCSDDLDYELFTKYTYLMNNGWQENIEMEINEDNTVDLPVYFGVNGTTGNNKDISLTLAVDEDTLADYNFDKNKYDEESYYLLLPEDCYAFDKTVYTIPAGSLNAGGVCKIDLNKLREHNIYAEYVLPIKIATSEGEPVGPSKYTKALYFLNLKNEYSGIYSGNGNMKQIGTSYTTQATGKQLYAISRKECYLYAGNVDRTTTGRSSFILNLHFNDDGTIKLTALNDAIELKEISGTYNFKFYENTSDTRKLVMMTTLYLKYEYKDITITDRDVRYSYEATLTKSEDVFKSDYPDASIEVED